MGFYVVSYLSANVVMVTPVWWKSLIVSFASEQYKLPFSGRHSLARMASFAENRYKESREACASEEQ